MQDEDVKELTTFELPEHGNELSLAEETIEKLKSRLKIIVTEKSITGESHEKIYEDTMRVLDFVGQLSVPAFALEDVLEEHYTKTYLHAPQLAKRLWLDHYGKLHQPYNLLKNRCFRLLEEIDAEYFKRHKKRPPNWKP